MTDIIRRKLVQGSARPPSLGPFAIGSRIGAGAQGRHRHRRVAADDRRVLVRRRRHERRPRRLRAPGRTPTAAFKGRKLRYVAEDTGFKVDQGVAVFKKIMAADKPSTSSTATAPSGVKAVAQDAIAAGTIMTASPRSPRCSPTRRACRSTSWPARPTRDARDPDGVHRAPTQGSAPSRSIAFVYTDTEFGTRRHPGRARRAPRSSACRSSPRSSPSSRASTSPPKSRSCAARGPTSSSSRATSWRRFRNSCASCARPACKPQVHGHRLEPGPPDLRSARRSRRRLHRRQPYRYDYDTDAPMIKPMRDYVGQTRPDVTEHLAVLHPRLAHRHDLRRGRRALHQGRQAADAAEHEGGAGIDARTGTPAASSACRSTYQGHQIPAGRVYQLRPGEEDDGAGRATWIKV